MRYWIVYIMKMLACFLILNFHSDRCFPGKLTMLAFGGDLGNNIFFLVSGFTLISSILTAKKKSFFEWFQRRFFRVFPLHCIFTLGSMVAMNIPITGKSLFHNFVFPPMYWFSAAIIIFYILLFWYEKIPSSLIRQCGIFVLCVIHLLFDSIYVEQYVMGFIAMIVGAEIGRNKMCAKCRNTKLICVLSISIILFFGLKLLRAKGIDFLGIVHLLIGVTTILIAVIILTYGVKKENEINQKMLIKPRLANAIKILSSLAFPTYLVTMFNDLWIVKKVSTIAFFPLNYVINLALTLILALLVARIENAIRNSLMNK